jgi:hypothetical protein
MSERDDAVLNAVSGRRTGHTGWVRGNCPWCVLDGGKEDRRQSLSLHAQSGGWHCHRCRESGRLREVPDDLASRAPEDRAAQTVIAELPEGYMPLWEETAWNSIACQPAIDYLLDTRRLDPELIPAARIGVCLRGFYANRLVVPIDGSDGKLAGWVSRTWKKAGDYRYMPGMQRASLLYNSRALRVRTDEPALAVEGVFDAFPYWPDGVAVLGKPSEGQVAELVAARRPVAVVLDGDAWREGGGLALRLRHEGHRSGWLELPPRTDPDEVPVDLVRREARACLA